MAKEGVDFEVLQKQRMEKDLHELQSLISTHFEQRKKDDQDLEALKERITKRKEQRAEQIRIRQVREKERLAKEKEERALKEAEEERRKEEEEARKKAAISNMSQHYGGYLARNDRQKGGNRRQTEREKKRKLLAERRKPLNIDHLQHDKLKDKVKELHKWMSILEEERYDFEAVHDRQKYDVNQLRQRVNEFMGKQGRGGKAGGKRQIKTLANVGARAGAFK
jgi:chromosome segregation ATPase